MNVTEAIVVVIILAVAGAVVWYMLRPPAPVEIRSRDGAKGDGLVSPGGAPPAPAPTPPLVPTVRREGYTIDATNPAHWFT